MINHILIPLDGSTLAECVLPHVLTIARGTNANISLLHVLELPHAVIDKQAVDPLEWHLRKQEAEEYLTHIAAKLGDSHLKVEHVIMEGSPAECVIDFADNNNVDLIARQLTWEKWFKRLEHQQRGTKNHFAFIQIIAPDTGLYVSERRLEEIRYARLFVGLDFSTRAEYILPVAINVAEFHKAELILGMVMRRPEMLHRFPLQPMRKA